MIHKAEQVTCSAFLYSFSKKTHTIGNLGKKVLFWQITSGASKALSCPAGL